MTAPRWDDVPRFARITTVEEYRALTLAWLRGEVRDLPVHAGPPARETAVILADLIAFNELGFLTENSQPATDRQRAVVSGFATIAAAEAIWWACNSVDLIATIELADTWRHPGDATTPGYGIPVTIHRGDPLEVMPGYVLTEGQPTTFAGRGLQGGAFALDTPSLTIEDLAEYAFVEVIDPTWGRNDVLWSTVRRALLAFS